MTDRPQRQQGLPGDTEQRFQAYLGTLAAALGHRDREAPFRAYCTGVLLPGERKSVEPMAAKLAPHRVRAAHQSLHHLVAHAPWRDEAILGAVRQYVLPVLQRRGAITSWLVDDTGTPKKGRHSVGVARQYCGQLGKEENCQVAVTLSVATAHASLPIAYRLYLPESWAHDPARRATAGVPPAVRFQTKPQLALAQVRAAVAQGVPRGVVLADVAYGNDTAFRTGVSALGLRYAVGLQASTTVWPPGPGPRPPQPWRGRGRPPTRVRRTRTHQPVAVKALAQALPPGGWQRVRWREGSRRELTSRFAAVRVRPAHRDYACPQPRPEEWLLIEWPEAEPAPTTYWLSTLPTDTPLPALVATAKGRWRIERDYQELKQELGLAHFEGRGWRGVHHHATLCIAAYGFLVAERSRFPPRRRGAPRRRSASEVSAGERPGDAGAARAARARLDPLPPTPCARRPRPGAAALPVLFARTDARIPPMPFMTQ